MRIYSSVGLPQAFPGRCRYCKCTDARACPEGCSWYDLEQTVCDSLACVKRFVRARVDVLHKQLIEVLREQKPDEDTRLYNAAAITLALRRELPGLLWSDGDG